MHLCDDNACVSFVRFCLYGVCVCLSVYSYLSVCVPVWQFNNTRFLKSKKNKLQALGLFWLGRWRLRLSLGVRVEFRLGQLAGSSKVKVRC